MKKSSVDSKPTKELEKSIAKELQNEEPDNAEQLLNENTTGVYRGGSATDNTGHSEVSKPEV